MSFENQVGIFVPLVLLLVAEFSSIAREIDLKKAVKEEWNTLGYAVERNSKYLSKIDPKMGRFPTIHNLNSLLILGTILLLVLSPEFSTISQILVALLIFTYALLPVLEIEDYDLLLREGQSIQSMYVQFFLTIIILLGIGATAYLGDPTSIVNETNAIGFIILMTLFSLAISTVFLLVLRDDFEKYNKNHGFEYKEDESMPDDEIENQKVSQ
ncbi:hypothetical protein ACLI4Q_05660 [Natrialbaceae archaeon A-CW1-1]